MNDWQQLAAVAKAGIPAGTRCKALLLALQILALARQNSPAQLAITEVMSSALGGPDFWELTNFGDDPIDLTSYSFNDQSAAGTAAPFTNLVVLAHQAVIFTEQRTAADTAESFRQWWGLSPDVPVVLYVKHGLFAGGDSLRLWSSTDANDEFLVDSITFRNATPGFTFIYDPLTDAFDKLSVLGIDAFQAATANDVGSPGTPPAPVPLAITAQPTNITANAGDTVTLTVRKKSLPPPTFQWFFNDVPISGARAASLTITNLQSEREGNYHVVLSNYFNVVWSEIATVSVSRVPVSPRWLENPSDQVVFEGQSPTFRAVATGVPQPSYQWYFNGIAISDAQTNNYTVWSAQLINTGDYTVVASNTNGAATNLVRLTVTRRPDLRITEAMGSRTVVGPPNGRADWWELTSYETTNSVDLYGYRFDEDNGGNGGKLALSWTNTNHVIIQPRESVIFVQDLTPTEFREWWGAANLPVDLQIVTYKGNGLGLDPFDEGIYFWNPGATTEGDIGGSPDRPYLAEWYDSNAPLGVSFTFDRNHPLNPCCDQLSVEGQYGAAAAEHGGDIGSPGYIDTPSEPRIKKINWDPSGCGLVWRSIPGRSYSVLYKNSLADANWIPLTQRPLRSSGPTTSYLDSNVAASARRFYRVFLEP